MNRIKIQNLFQNEKNREIFTNVFFSFVIKGFSLIVSLVSMPMYISYFHNEAVLGIWFTIVSLLNWLLAFDLGLGNGLRNKLVGTIVKNDTKKSKSLISTAYFYLGIISVISFTVCYFLISSINLNSLLNISSVIISNSVLLKCMVILLLGVVLSFFLRLINSVLYAMQKSSITNFITLISSVIPLAYMLLISPSDNMSNNLINLSFVQVIANCLPLVIVSFIVFSSKGMKKCRPNFRYADVNTCKEIFGLGGLFFIAQISFMLLINSNEILISNFYDPKYVVDYSIYNRLFTAFGTLFTLALAPLWSSVTKALNENDHKWIRNIYRYLNVITIVAVVVQFATLPFLQMIINLWMGKGTLVVNFDTAIIFAAFGSVYIYNIVLTTIANGMGALKPQIMIYTVGMLLKIPFIFILQTLSIPWVGIVLYNFVVLLLFCIIEKISIQYLFKKIENNSETKLNSEVV